MDTVTINDDDSQSEEELPDIDDLPVSFPTTPLPSTGSATSSPFVDTSFPSTSRTVGNNGKKMPTTPPVPAVKDSDGFLAPPPASTLLIRRTRTSSTGGATYVVSPATSETDQSSPPLKRRFSSGDLTKAGVEGEGHADVDVEASQSRASGDEGAGNSGGGKNMSHYGNVSKMKRGRKSMFSRVNKIKEKLKVRKPVNIDPATGKRRYKKRTPVPFTMHRKSSMERMTTESVHHERGAEPEEHEESKEVVSQTWRPTDDLRLIVNTLQTNDLKQVHMGVKFSCRYTLQEIRDRWNKLMYNEKVSKVALTACRNLHSKVKRKIYASALFSEAELKKLESIPSNSNPTLATFEELLRDNIIVFHEARSAKDLQRCWMQLKDLHMLCDQDVRKHFERGSEDFADFEASVNDEDVRNLSIDPAVMHEILHEEGRNKKRIRLLEQEIGAWQSLADLVWEGQIIKAPDFDDNTFALIRGKNVRFAMAAKEITLGRRTRDNWVDADLSEEGNDSKISRRQATIKMRALGDFVILNQGRHPMYIDGQAVLSGEVAYLHDQSVIRVSTLTFVFIINEKLLNDLRKKIIEEESNAEHIEIAETTAPPPPASPALSNSFSKGRTKDTSQVHDGAVVSKPKSSGGSNTTPKPRKSVIVSPKHKPAASSEGSGPGVTTTGKEKPPAKKSAAPRKSAPRKPKAADAAKAGTNSVADAKSSGGSAVAPIPRNSLPVSSTLASIPTAVSTGTPTSVSAPTSQFTPSSVQSLSSASTQAISGPSSQSQIPQPLPGGPAPSGFSQPSPRPPMTLTSGPAVRLQSSSTTLITGGPPGPAPPVLHTSGASSQPSAPPPAFTSGAQSGPSVPPVVFTSGTSSQPSPVVLASGQPLRQPTTAPPPYNAARPPVISLAAPSRSVITSQSRPPPAYPGAQSRPQVAAPGVMTPPSRPAPPPGPSFNPSQPMTRPLVRPQAATPILLSSAQLSGGQQVRPPPSYSMSTTNPTTVVTSGIGGPSTPDSVKVPSTQAAPSSAVTSSGDLSSGSGPSVVSVSSTGASSVSVSSAETISDTPAPSTSTVSTTSTTVAHSSAPQAGN